MKRSLFIPLIDKDDVPDAQRIQAMAEADLLERAIVQAVETFNACTYADVKNRFDALLLSTQRAFNDASQEEKVSREEMMERVSQPLVPVPALPTKVTERFVHATKEPEVSSRPKVDVMRKHMTRVLRESLEGDDSVVYLG